MEAYGMAKAILRAYQGYYVDEDFFISESGHNVIINYNGQTVFFGNANQIKTLKQGDWIDLLHALYQRVVT